MAGQGRFGLRGVGSLGVRHLGEDRRVKSEGDLMANQSPSSSSHWEKTKSLLFKTLAVWAFFAFVIHWFGSALNGAPGSFPGGYFMAGQGAQIAFAILIFWYVNKQNQIDEDHGVAEE
jgi:putative solute:sodium symporter small subunit